MNKEQIEKISNQVIGIAIQVHSMLGPGLLESVYECVLAYELTQSGLEVQRQVPIPLSYKDLYIKAAFRADIVVENCIIIELISVRKLDRVHSKQLLSYLRISGMHLGLLFNFNRVLLKDDMQRIINGHLA